MSARFPRPVRFLLLAALVMVAGLYLGRRATKMSEREKRGESVASPIAGAAVPSARPAVTPAAPPAIRRALFTFATPVNAIELDAALPAPTQKINYVRLDADLIAGKRSPFWQKPGAGRVVLPLPDGGALTVVIDESEMLGADRWTSTGRLEGRPQSSAVFAWNRGFLHVSIADAELGSFALRAATEELSQFYQIEPALVAPCGGERRVSLEKGSLPPEARPRAGGVPTVTAPIATDEFAAAATDNSQRVEVHVMMAYTQAVLTTLTGAARTDALQSAFDAEIAKVNAAFATSLIQTRVKLVKIVQTQYDENASFPTAVQNDALTALQALDDGRMDELHLVRDQVGADLVCLALNRPDAFSSGLGFVLDTPGDNANHRFAFSVVQYSNLAGTTVVPHELGHNFGCAHDRRNALGPGAYPYSYGYRFTVAGVEYHDIMAYPPGVALPYFSNSAISAPAPAPAGSPGGIAAGQLGESNTALTIEQDAFEVAGYRLQTQAAPNSGTLSHVATRAFVGTGTQALIGGFTIEGPAQKTLLLRGVGPGLRAFGVADAIASPRLELFSGATLLNTSDSWTLQPNAAAIATAVPQSGTFAFAPGSADAALLVTLPAGAYTAVVRGVPSAAGPVATGTALLEAYEVGSTPGRFVNLATRGYADNVAKPLLGSFYVSAALGTTKRILIRVLGPSLNFPPYNFINTLYDPFMELRNAAGELVHRNDDWSSGTATGRFNPDDDYTPLVKYYNERQIAATGLAPANRREPCLMVDLPPGAYTVVVKPFELRDLADPSRDEPAVPGLGLIEVYEINR